MIFITIKGIWGLVNVVLLPSTLIESRKSLKVYTKMCLHSSSHLGLRWKFSLLFILLQVHISKLHWQFLKTILNTKFPMNGSGLAKEAGEMVEQEATSILAWEATETASRKDCHMSVISLWIKPTGTPWGKTVTHKITPDNIEKSSYGKDQKETSQVFSDIYIWRNSKKFETRY